MEPPPDAEAAHERDPDPGMEPDPKRQRVVEGVGGGAQEDDAFRGLQEQCKRLEAALAQVTGAAEEERTRSRAQIELLRLEVLLLRRQLPAHQSTAVAKEMKEASDMAASGEKEVPPVIGVPAPPVPGQESDDANVGNGEHLHGESSRNSSAASEEDSTMAAEKSVDRALDHRRSPVASAPPPPSGGDESDDVSSRACNLFV